MSVLRASANDLWHAAINGDTVKAAGRTRRGETTISRHNLVSDSDASAFLDAVGKRAGKYRPLPEGETLEPNEVYGKDGELVIVKRRATYDGGALSRDDFVTRSATTIERRSL